MNIEIYYMCMFIYSKCSETAEHLHTSPIRWYISFKRLMHDLVKVGQVGAMHETSSICLGHPTKNTSASSTC